MKSYTTKIFSAVIGLHLICSCNKNADLGLNTDTLLTDSIALRVRLNNYGSTRALEHATFDGDEVIFDPQVNKILLYSGTVNAPGSVIDVLNGVNFEKTLSSSASTIYQATESFEHHTGSIAVEFNSDGLEYVHPQSKEPQEFWSRTLTNNINTRQGSTRERGSSATGGFVRITGHADVVGASPKTADIIAKPDVARIQIIDDIYDDTFGGEGVQTTFKNLRIEAMYLNRSKVLREDSDLHVTPSSKTDWAADFAEKSYAEYNNGAGKPKAGLSIPTDDLALCVLTDEKGVIDYNLPSSTMDFFGFFDRQAYEYYDHDLDPATADIIDKGSYSAGFNLYPQGARASTLEEAKQMQPHLIIRIGYSQRAVLDEKGNITDWETADYINGRVLNSELTDGDTSNDYGYINIQAYKTSDGLFPAFEAGKVYQLSMKEILELLYDTKTVTVTDPENPDPEEPLVPNNGSLVMTIKVIDWETTEIKPNL